MFHQGPNPPHKPGLEIRLGKLIGAHTILQSESKSPIRRIEPLRPCVRYGDGLGLGRALSKTNTAAVAFLLYNYGKTPPLELNGLQRTSLITHLAPFLPQQGQAFFRIDDSGAQIDLFFRNLSDGSGGAYPDAFHTHNALCHIKNWGTYIGDAIKDSGWVQGINRTEIYTPVAADAILQECFFDYRPWWTRQCPCSTQLKEKKDRAGDCSAKHEMKQIPARDTHFLYLTPPPMEAGA